jgi:3-isopropylmalate dehydratase small subunit
LLGITITDDSFHEAAADGAEIEIDLEGRKVQVGGREWSFELSAMELKLIETGGISGAFRKFGKKLFEIKCAPAKTESKQLVVSGGSDCESTKELQW